MSTNTHPAVAVAPVAQATNEFQFPFLDLQAQFSEVGPEIMSAVQRVLKSQQFILGPDVALFETQIAEFVGSSFAVGCASGTDALLLALMALYIGPGDEVITTPFTFVATAGVIARTGASIVFVDIDPVTFNISPELIMKAVTPKTRAVIPVHLFGQSAEMDKVTQIASMAGIYVIEDAAQAIGAKWGDRNCGSIGDLGCFSFFPSKNLGGAGDGGMVTTNNEALARRLRLLRAHGSRTKYDYEILGVNSRLDAMQAAILSVKMKYLSSWNLARRHNADCYRRLFAEAGLQGCVNLPAENSKSFHVYNQYVIRTAERNGLRLHLKKLGVPTETYYPSPLHLQQAFKYLGYSKGDFPEAEAAAREVLALPIFPELTFEHQCAVVSAIAQYFGKELKY